jgi:serine protein kinase
MQQQDGNNDNRTTFNISERLESLRREQDALKWEGTFRDYFELVSQNPRLAQLSHARLNDMVHAAGLERINEGARDETTRYNFFADELYGIEEPIARIVEYFKSAAQRLEVRKRILLPHGTCGRRQIHHRHDAQTRAGRLDAHASRRGLCDQGLPDARGTLAPHSA